MELLKAIDELKEQIAEAEKAEQEPEVTEAPSPTPEPTPEPTPAPTEAPEATPSPTPELDDKGYARLRREKQAAEKRANELAERVAKLEAKPAEEVEEAPQVEIPPALTEILQDHQITKATREFQEFENKFKSREPSYEAVSSEYAMALAQSIRIQNPRKSDMWVAEETKRTILNKAANYLREGFDPIEELFHEAKDLGFTGASRKAKEEPKEEVREEPKPDMKKLAENRKKSTGMGSSSGRSEGQMTKQYAATELSAEEWAKLPVAEKRRLMYAS